MTELDQNFNDELEQAFETDVPEPEVEPEQEAPSQPDSDPDLETAKRFLGWVNNNPSGWEDLVAWEKGEKVLTAPQQEYQPVPDFSPPADEEVDYYSEEYLKGLGERVRYFEQVQYQREASESRAVVDEGITKFLRDHSDLERDDIVKVMSWVRDRNVLSSIPPEYTPMQRLDAVAERFEEGYRALYWERQQAEGRKQVVNDLAKRRKASSASSSSMSSPRTPPPARTSEEHRQAFTDGIAEALEQAT